MVVRQTRRKLKPESHDVGVLVAVAIIMAVLVSTVQGFSVSSASSSKKAVSYKTSASLHQNHCPHNHHPQHYYPLLLAVSGKDGMEEFENARQEFEKLMTTSPRSSTATASMQDKKKPLTASTKRLMELELKLLKQLDDSDEVVDPLVELWTAERADAAKDLQEMELGNCSPGLVREEAQLRAMIERYGSEWVEPMSRLAVLLFTKGRLMEAMDLIRKVLIVKPWHFEAGQLLVVMLLRNGDYTSAIKAARSYTLPELNEHTQNRRRKKWVNEKVKLAQEMLRGALEATTTAIHPDVTTECPVDEPFCWQ